MADKIHAPTATKEELIAHMDDWIKQMADFERRFAGMSLYDMQVSTALLKGALEDVAHLYMIVREVAKRLPEEQ